MDCRVLSRSIIENIKNKIKNEKITPGLGVILVGNSQASLTYIKHKRKACEEAGILFKLIHLSENSSQKNIIDIIKIFNNDKEIHGVLIQLPLPKHISEEDVLRNVEMKKDVDGFHAYNMGCLAMHNRTPLFVPCTPLGCIKILDKLGCDLKGKNIVIIGKSNIVGLPLGLILMKRDATITMCDKFTKDITSFTKNADIMIVACGQPLMVKKDWIKEDCIVLDVGINHINEGSRKKLVGDVDYDDIIEKASYVTPVPGGVGPMTIAMLINNTYDAFYINNE